MLPVQSSADNTLWGVLATKWNDIPEIWQRVALVGALILIIGLVVTAVGSLLHRKVQPEPPANQPLELEPSDSPAYLGDEDDYFDAPLPRENSSVLGAMRDRLIAASARLTAPKVDYDNMGMIDLWTLGEQGDKQAQAAYEKIMGKAPPRDYSYLDDDLMAPEEIHSDPTAGISFENIVIQAAKMNRPFLNKVREWRDAGSDEWKKIEQDKSNPNAQILRDQFALEDLDKTEPR